MWAGCGRHYKNEQWNVHLEMFCIIYENLGPNPATFSHANHPTKVNQLFSLRIIHVHKTLLDWMYEWKFQASEKQCLLTYIGC